MYPPLELGQPGNPPCPNGPEAAATLLCPGSRRLLLQVAKQTALVQFGTMPQGIGAGAGSIVWQPPQPFLPMVASLVRHFDAVRVWNYTPGAEAQIFATASNQ